MRPFKTILVNIDATAPAHPALARAVALAAGCGATLLITDVVADEPYARRQLPVDDEAVLGHHRAQLARIGERVRNGVPVEYKVLSGHPAAVLMAEAERLAEPLLVYAPQTARADDAYPFGATGMDLLRNCRCPVLLLHPDHLAAPRLIAGAVDASTHEASEQALNRQIVDLTRLMAQLEGAEPLLLQAWEPFGARVVRSNASDEAFTAYVEEARQRAEGELRALARATLEAPELQIVLRRGKADEVIRDFVETRGVGLVVMGSVARAGLAGLLLGNTAERLLHTLSCSVLAVKPAAA